MDAESLIHHVDRDMETTSFPLSVTPDWLDDGNETTGNQFQQPDWQVGGIERNQKLKLLKSEPAPSYSGKKDSHGSLLHVTKTHAV